MMKVMKEKKEFFILGGIVVFLGALIIVLNANQGVHFKIPALEKIEKKAIVKVELKQPDNSLTLLRESGRWYVGPKKYAADPDAVNDILKNIVELEPTDLVSKAKGYFRFKLDPTERIAVKAYNEDGDALRHFYVGKAASSYQHTFIRLGDDAKGYVYTARGNFRTDFDKSVADLRDNVIFRVGDPKKVQSVTVRQGGRKLVMNAVQEKKAPETAGDGEKQTVTPETVTVWKNSGGKKLKKSKITGLLDRIKKLKCKSFFPDDQKPSGKPIYTVVVNDGKPSTLMIYAKKKDDDHYPAASSQTAYAFKIAKSTAEKIMEKPADFLSE